LRHSATIWHSKVKVQWDGILNGCDSRLKNGGVQAAKSRARGDWTTRNFINMDYLVATELKHLPASPCDTTSGFALR
jgi:hypothetical protein